MADTGPPKINQGDVRPPRSLTEQLMRALKTADRVLGEVVAAIPNPFAAEADVKVKEAEVVIEDIELVAAEAEKGLEAVDAALQPHVVVPPAPTPAPPPEVALVAPQPPATTV